MTILNFFDEIGFSVMMPPQLYFLFECFCFRCQKKVNVLDDHHMVFFEEDCTKTNHQRETFFGWSTFLTSYSYLLFLLYKLIRSAHKSCFCATAYLELLISPHIPQQRFCFRNEKGSSDEDLFEKVKPLKAILRVKSNDSHLTGFFKVLFNSTKSGLYYIYSDLVIFQISYFFSEEEYQ